MNPVWLRIFWISRKNPVWPNRWIAWKNLKELLSDAVEFENNLLERFKLQDEKDIEDVQPEDEIIAGYQPARYFVRFP